MKDMDLWIRRYDNARTNPYESNKTLLSNRFDLEGLSWKEISEIYVPELGCEFGPGCNGLRKSWYAYKMTKRNGEYAGDLALRINRVQSALGFPRTEFEELDRYGGSIDEEFSGQEEESNFEEQLMREEMEDNSNQGALSRLSEEEQQEQSDLNSEVSELDKQLMREELEDQRNTLGLIDSEEEVEEEQDW